MAAERNRPLIIICEDDISNQQLLKLFLRQNVEVIICDSEASLFSKLAHQKAELIIMDISLNYENEGIEIIRKLKNEKLLSEIPIICISGFGFTNERETAISSGASEFLIKPIQKEVLLAAIERLLKF